MTHLKAIPTHAYFWTWINPMDEEIYDAYFDTEQEADDSIGQWWAERCEDDGGRNGEVVSESAELVRFFYNEDTGEREIVERKKITIEYEFYHGDRAEHGYP